MNMKALTKENFGDALKASEYLVVDFWADWCGPCKMMAPVFEQVSTALQDKMAFAKVNIDECEEIAIGYGVQAIPTFLVFRNGEVIERMVGFMQKNSMIDSLNKILQKEN